MQISNALNNFAGAKVLLFAEQLTNTEDYEMEKKEIIDVILCIDKEMLRRKSMSGELGSDVSPNVRSPAQLQIM